MKSETFQFSFEKLDVWKLARSFSLKIYKLTKSFPYNEKQGLKDQLRRAAVSISSNIAEGSSRFSRKDFARYIQISYGSLMEALSQLYTALDLGYIDDKVFNDCKTKIHEIAKKLSALRKSILEK